MMNDANVDFWIRLHCESSQDCNTSGCTILVPAPIDDYIEADNAGEENAASAKQDKAVASNDRDLILASLQGISSIVTKSPLDDFEKFVELYNDPSQELLDF